MSASISSTVGGGRSGGDSTAAVRISSEIVVAAIIFCFMVVVLAFFFYLYAKRHLRSPFRDRSQARFVFAAPNVGQGAGPAHGCELDAAVLRLLSFTVYRAADFEEGVDCAVCLSDLADGEAARLLPKCGHVFHLNCIDMWFHSHSTCPLCRCPVGANPNAGAPRFETRLESPVLARNSATAVAPEGPSSSSGSSTSSSNKPPEGALAIEMPRRATEEYYRSPISPLEQSRPAAMEETATSPVPARFRPLRRLWSQGRRTAASSCSPRGGDIEQGLGGCGEEGSSGNASCEQ